MRSDWLSPNPLHVADTLAEIKIPPHNQVYTINKSTRVFAKLKEKYNIRILKIAV